MTIFLLSFFLVEDEIIFGCLGIGPSASHALLLCA